MAILKTTSKQAEQEILPRHIAIVMDGNGRWAKKRGLPRTAGHAVGAETFRKIAYACRDMGIEYLTVYAFSTENWKRSQDEVNTIMELLKKYLNELVDTLVEKGVHVKVLGDKTGLSEELQELIRKVEAISDTIESPYHANICINYGGRDEIVKAAQKWASDPERPPLTEEVFSHYLYSDGIPDPDLVIRPSGEERISNFLLWQSAYSEFYFTDTLWPDFNEKTLRDAISAYQKRDRRFGNAK